VHVRVFRRVNRVFTGTLVAATTAKGSRCCSKCRPVEINAFTPDYVYLPSRGVSDCVIHINICAVLFRQNKLGINVVTRVAAVSSTTPFHAIIIINDIDVLNIVVVDSYELRKACFVMYASETCIGNATNP
jgi:hypothetical protein